MHIIVLPQPNICGSPLISLYIRRLSTVTLVPVLKDRSSLQVLRKVIWWLGLMRVDTNFCHKAQTTQLVRTGNPPVYIYIYSPLYRWWVGTPSFLDKYSSYISALRFDWHIGSIQHIHSLGVIHVRWQNYLRMMYTCEYLYARVLESNVPITTLTVRFKYWWKWPLIGTLWQRNQVPFCTPPPAPQAKVNSNLKV